MFSYIFIEATGLSRMRRLFLRGLEENFAKSPDGQLEHVFAFPEGSRLATESLGRGRVRMIVHHMVHACSLCQRGY